ncbi:suppressor of fused domain protein [Flavobacterium sp. F372]|uniref:Suppressor of fused domain protein n=1 Tax=Flavobacterium bernardetii TaxID=2813823 RepID=A0ABR7J2M8_9FLAO|nr:suppressor of fused domain protein [Flavobacterium bernardetii]MBC5836291.1 suppressor of fused domain protein [Flavobacterium bernardetii]NHF71508.1 suppressor of fused domain protein [Flavobacterium bernardetii]
MDIEEILDYFQNKEYFEEHSEWIAEHVEKHFPNEEVKVFHEFMSLDFKLHVYFIKPKKLNYNILLTSGMSSLEMNVPEIVEEKDNYKFAELMLLIPKDIEFNEVYTGENKNDFIIKMLKVTGKFPHHYDTWLGIGHTIRYSEDLESYSADTNFIGGVILPSATFEEDFTEIIKDGRIINIYSFFPLYENELNYKIENGYNALLDLIIKNNCLEILDNNRKNITPKKSFWNKLRK